MSDYIIYRDDKGITHQTFQEILNLQKKLKWMSSYGGKLAKRTESLTIARGDGNTLIDSKTLVELNSIGEISTERWKFESWEIPGNWAVSTKDMILRIVRGILCGMEWYYPLPDFFDVSVPYLCAADETPIQEFRLVQGWILQNIRKISDAYPSSKIGPWRVNGDNSLHSKSPVVLKASDIQKYIEYDRETDALPDLEEQFNEQLEMCESLEILDVFVKRFKLVQGTTHDIGDVFDIRQIPKSGEQDRYKSLYFKLKRIDRLHPNFDRPVAFAEFCKNHGLSRYASDFYDTDYEGPWELFSFLCYYFEHRSKNKHLYIAKL